MPRNYNVLSKHVNSSLSRLNSDLSDTWNTFISPTNGKPKNTGRQQKNKFINQKNRNYGCKRKAQSF